jgi:uncharacterized YccA/Bax inhibitor family protein
MRSMNPALNDSVFQGHTVDQSEKVMTIEGTVHRTGLLLIVLLAAASWTWSIFFDGGGASGVIPLTIGGAIGGLVFAMITIFRKTTAPLTAPMYAACEGLFLGGLSAIMEARFPGIVIQAVSLTFATLFALLMAYRSGLIAATENFKLGVTAATGGIAMVYVATMVMGFFGISVPFIHESGLIGIGFSLFVVVIAALNLVMDFDFIENGAEIGAPKYLEWYAAFGLLVTLVWLYIEFLRLLSKLNSRR